MKDFSKWGTFYNYISYQQELLQREEQPCLFFVSQLYVWLASAGCHDDDVLCRQQELEVMSICGNRSFFTYYLSWICVVLKSFVNQFLL